MPVLRVPETLLAYYEDEAIRAAVDSLAGNLNSKHAPSLGWTEARDYNQAVLMTAKVRADYVEFLYALWEATWGEAELSRLGSDDLSQSLWTPDEVWDDRILSRVFRGRKAPEGVWESLYVEAGKEGVRLRLYRWGDDDQAREVSDVVAAAGWREEADEEDDPSAVTDAVPLRKFLREPEENLPRLQASATAMVEMLAPER